MRCLAIVVALLLAACAGTPPAVRSPVVPLGAPLPPVDVTRDQGPRADADRSPPVPVAEPAGGGDASVTYRTVTRIVETPAAPPTEPVSAEPIWTSGASGQPGDPVATDYGYYYGSRSQREPWFPVGTIVGAGIGSAIGHHHGDSAEGAWIGASVGMLFDMQHWWH